MTFEPATIAAGTAGAMSPEQRVIEVAVQRIAGTALSSGRDLLAVELDAPGAALRAEIGLGELGHEKTLR